MKKTYLNKSIITIIAIKAILVYFIAMFFILKPNILTWWSDEYEYISSARNFALFSKLETSFYSAKAVLSGDFPSFGYHPILYSFIAGLFLKIFSGAPWATFIFNYLLTAGTILILYFYARERIEKKYIPYPLILTALFPITLIYANTQSPEIFFMMLVPLIFFLYFKNGNKYNIFHFLILLLIAVAACQRFTYHALFILPILTYIIWARQRKPLHIISSIIFYWSSWFLLNRAFGAGIQPYPATHEDSIYFYLKEHSISILLDKGTPLLLAKYILHNLKNIFYIYTDPSSVYFLFHWLVLIMIVINILILFRLKAGNQKRELLILLIPELLLILASITAYPWTDLEHFSHLRPFIGFIPLNLFVLVAGLRLIRIKLRSVLSVLFGILFLFSSYLIIKPFYVEKIDKENSSINSQVSRIEEVFDKYSYKDSLNFAGTDDPEYPLRDYIVYGSKDYRFIRTNQFDLDEEDLIEFSNKPFIDMWVEKESNLWTVKMNNYFIKEHYRNFPYIFDANIGGNEWVVLLKEDAFEKEYNFRTNIDNFTNAWTSVNQCMLSIKDDQMLIKSSGSDPYFENTEPFDLGKDTDYYIKIVIIPPASTYTQFFFKISKTEYSEENSTKFIIEGGKENTIISKINSNMIRIDPGTVKGNYIIKELGIYSFSK